MARISIRLSLIQALEPIECSCSVYDTNTKQECLDFGFDFVNGLVNGLAHVYVSDHFCNRVKSKITSCGVYKEENEYLNKIGCSIVCNATCGVASGFIVKVKSLGGFPNCYLLDDALSRCNIDRGSNDQSRSGFIVEVWNPIHCTRSFQFGSDPAGYPHFGNDLHKMLYYRHFALLQLSSP